MTQRPAFSQPFETTGLPGHFAQSVLHGGLCVSFLFALFALWVAEASASPELAITELWPGGLDGEEATSDWIEITNVGDATFDAWSTLRMREGLLSPTLPDGLTVSGGVFVGVDELAPGESAVFLTAYEADFFDAWSLLAPRIFNPADFDEAAEAFRATWGPNVDGIKLGALDSSSGGPWQGLSANGEAISLYVADDGVSFVTGGLTQIDAVEYPVSDPASWTFSATPTDQASPRLGVLSISGVDQAFTGIGPANGALLPTVTTGAPPVGSPGVVPEPTAALVLCSLIAPLQRRR